VNVLVDTPVWSLALRRRKTSVGDTEITGALADLIRDGRARLIGPVRQELLTGIREPAQFEKLREVLRAFPDVDIETGDFEGAASVANRCRGQGIQGSSVDFLICAVAVRRGFAVFTTDKDFGRYAPIAGLTLYQEFRQLPGLE
jgi:predicted nucleic acid-binding protein